LEANVGKSTNVAPGKRDGRLMEIVANELGIREGLRHNQRRSAVTATDVCHFGTAFKLCDHAFQRRQPLTDEVPLVARPEEALDAAEEAIAPVTPAQPRAGLEGLRELRLVGEDRRE